MIIVHTDFSGNLILFLPSNNAFFRARKNILINVPRIKHFGGFPSAILNHVCFSDSSTVNSVAQHFPIIIDCVLAV